MFQWIKKSRLWFTVSFFTFLLRNYCKTHKFCTVVSNQRIEKQNFCPTGLKKSIVIRFQPSQTKILFLDSLIQTTVQNLCYLDHFPEQTYEKWTKWFEIVVSLPTSDFSPSRRARAWAWPPDCWSPRVCHQTLSLPKEVSNFQPRWVFAPTPYGKLSYFF